jgi:hypothetical protein
MSDILITGALMIVGIVAVMEVQRDPDRHHWLESMAGGHPRLNVQFGFGLAQPLKVPSALFVGDW